MGLRVSAGHDQSQFLRGGLSGADTPPVHAKAARQRHEHLFLAPARRQRINDPWPPLPAQPVLRLEFQQPPRQFAQGPS